MNTTEGPTDRYRDDAAVAEVAATASRFPDGSDPDGGRPAVRPGSRSGDRGDPAAAKAGLDHPYSDFGSSAW